MVINAELFTANLDSKGIKYMTDELPDNGTVVTVMSKAGATHVFFDSDDDGQHVAFRTRLESCPEDKVADMLMVCNVLNGKYRWLKFYVNLDDNNIMVEDDAILSPETAGEECFELLGRTVNILDEVKPLIMKVIYA